MKKNVLTTILVAVAICIVVLSYCLGKIVYDSNHYEIDITVYYEGERYESFKLNAGDTLMLLKDPVKDGYKFEGWFADAEYTTPFDFDMEIKKDIAIYAKMVQE